MFVVVSGIPGSGKSTLARAIAPALGLRTIDKDAILESLFAAEFPENLERRRILSRQSDALFQRAAIASDGAVLVTFWHLTGMRPDSGTPVEWLRTLPRPIVQVRCVCPPAVAAERFLRRARHAGHMDHTRSDEILDDLTKLAQMPPVDVDPCINVDTAAVVETPLVVSHIRNAIDGSHL